MQNTFLEFQKIFLYKDEKMVDLQIKSIMKAADILNLFISNTERVMRTKFNNAEKIELKNNAKEFIKENLRSKYPFKNADDKFNLEAMGMAEIETTYHDFEMNSGKWLYYNYAINKNGFFELSESEILKINDEYSYYTENSKQNEALRITEGLAKLFDEAEELGIVNNYFRKDIANVCSLLEISVHPVVGKYRIMTNKYLLRSISNLK